MRLLVSIMLVLGEILGPRQARAAEEWSTADRWLGGAAFTATLVDWGQTLHIARHPAQFYESNLASQIGRHPSVSRVNSYFVGSIVFYGTAAHLLPSTYRKLLLSGVFVMRLDVIHHNYSVGIKVDLP